MTEMSLVNSEPDPRHNPMSINPRSLNYRVHRRRYIRAHTRVDHRWAGYMALHIPHDPEWGVKA